MKKKVLDADSETIPSGFVPFPSDFQPEGTKAEELAQEVLGHRGACFGSKTTYSWFNPTSLVVFNSNVFLERIGKVWHGDLDVTRDHKKLQTLANRSKLKVFVLYEMDGRFGNEKTVDAESSALIAFNPSDGAKSDFKIKDGYEQYYEKAKRGRYAGAPVIKKEHRRR